MIDFGAATTWTTWSCEIPALDSCQPWCPSETQPSNCISCSNCSLSRVACSLPVFPSNASRAKNSATSWTASFVQKWGSMYLHLCVRSHCRTFSSLETSRPIMGRMWTAEALASLQCDGSESTKASDGEVISPLWIVTATSELSKDFRFDLTVFKFPALMATTLKNMVHYSGASLWPVLMHIILLHRLCQMLPEQVDVTHIPTQSYMAKNSTKLKAFMEEKNVLGLDRPRHIKDFKGRPPSPTSEAGIV